MFNSNKLTNVISISISNLLLGDKAAKKRDL